MCSKGEDAKRTVKWSAHDIQVFLETYNKNYELLWNIRHNEYTNKAKRESAMLRLKDDLVGLGIAVPDLVFLRARVKAIKSTYRSELLKVNESKRSGADSDEIYKPKLPWFAAADVFMRDVIITRKSIHNYQTPLTNASGNDEFYNGDIKIETCVETEDNPYWETADNPVLEEAPTPPPPPVKRQRQSTFSKVEGAIEKLRTITETRASTCATEDQADETEIFGRYVAVQLRDLPIIKRLILQDRIQSMLMRERLKVLQQPRLSSPPLFCGTSSYGGESDAE